jgi:hypothetical protein
MLKSLGVVGVIVLIIAIICLAPMLFLWSVNSLAELGGVNFYIEHTAWSYFVSLIFIIITRGNK